VAAITHARIASVAVVLFGIPLACWSADDWLKHPTPGIPRTRTGAPDLSAPAPRTPDRRPDISGLWSSNGEPYYYDIGFGLTPAGVPLKSEPERILRARKENMGKDSPNARCLPYGVPAVEIVPTPFKIIQSRDSIAVLYEINMEYRQIFLDGRSLPKDSNPTWLGYSVGRWDRDTLIVETAGFKDDIWLDQAGTPATDALKVTEHFSRRDFGHIDLEIGLEDPKTFTKPWSLTLHLRLQADTDLIESVCSENNKGLQHLIGK